VPQRRFRGPRGPGASRREFTDEHRRGPLPRGEPLINIASAERAAIDLSLSLSLSPSCGQSLRRTRFPETFSRSCDGHPVSLSKFTAIRILPVRRVCVCIDVGACINLAIMRIARAIVRHYARVPLGIAPINESRFSGYPCPTVNGICCFRTLLGACKA